MKKSIAILVLSGLAVCAAAFGRPDDKTAQDKAAPANQNSANQSAGKKKSTKAVKAPPAQIQPLTIPKDAVARPDGTYSYTDKKGEKWIFSKTPFGISRIQDMGPKDAEAAAQKRRQYIKATDNGDTVTFVRQTPFGPTHWEKKKSDLSDEERQILEAQQPKSQATDVKPE